MSAQPKIWKTFSWFLLSSASSCKKSNESLISLIFVVLNYILCQSFVLTKHVGGAEEEEEEKHPKKGNCSSKICQTKRFSCCVRIGHISFIIIVCNSSLTTEYSNWKNNNNSEKKNKKKKNKMYDFTRDGKRFYDVNIFGTLSSENELLECTLLPENRRAFCVLFTNKHAYTQTTEWKMAFMEAEKKKDVRWENVAK